MEDKFFEVNQYRIRYEYYTANNNNAIVVLVHGLGEHVGRYEEWAAKFNPFNYAICGLDLPGHGKSNGKRGHIRNYNDFYEILDSFLDKLKIDFPNKPIILYGHSMGGNIVCNYILDRNPELKAAILSSPWFELSVKPNSFKFWLAKTMYKIFPSYSDKTNLDSQAISRIPEEVKKYNSDKLVHGKITPGLFIPVFFKGKKAIKLAQKIKMPMLVFHGTGDMLTDANASHRFSERGDKITFQSYEGGFHELHHDLCRDELHSNILDWLSSNVIMR